VAVLVDQLDVVMVLGPVVTYIDHPAPSLVDTESDSSVEETPGWQNSLEEHDYLELPSGLAWRAPGGPEDGTGWNASDEVGHARFEANVT
jgi:hypothetical protein